MTTTNTTIPSNNRRGAAVAAVVVLIAAVQMVAITSVGGGRHDADQAIRRVMTQRAYFAADSAALIACRQAQSGQTPPAAGTTLVVGNATATFKQTTGALTAGDIVVEGKADNSARRVKISLSTSVP